MTSRMRYDFLIEAYATERIKVVSAWSMFTDNDLLVRPHPCRWRRKWVPVWRLRGSQVWGYALASGGRRNREESDCSLSQAGLSSVLARGVR